MKISSEHYKKLESEVKEVLKDNPTYLEDCKALGEKKSSVRVRWNLFHMVCDKDHYTFARTLWEYCNDDHIDTALKRIVGGLT